jgi:hypothetical protein
LGSDAINGGALDPAINGRAVGNALDGGVVDAAINGSVSTWEGGLAALCGLSVETRLKSFIYIYIYTLSSLLNVIGH